MRVAVAMVAVCGGGGLLAESIGVATGAPFGGYAYTDALGPGLLGVPAVIPLAWVMMAWPAYLVGVRLAPRVAGLAGGGAFGRERLVRVVVAAWSLAAWDLFLDPQMVDAGYWRWDEPSPALPGVPTVPISNYVGWLVVSLVMMAALDRLLGRIGAESAAPEQRRSARTGAGDGVPFGLYLWTWASSALAHAAFFGLPGSAVAGGIGMGLVAVPLSRSLRPARVST